MEYYRLAHKIIDKHHMRFKYIEQPSTDKYIESTKSRKAKQRSLGIKRGNVELFFNKVYELVRSEK